MATRNESRAYRMTLEQFDRYLRDKRGELDNCVNEMQEVQQRLQAAFRSELEVWQGLFSTALPQVAERRDELPADFRRHLDRVEAEELARLQAEMVDLESKISTGRRDVDALTETAQAAAGALRQTNPTLNRREEELKRQITTLQDAYTEAYQALMEARQPALGWLTNASAISRARRRQKEIKKEQAAAIEELRRVRQDWLAAVEKTGETQSRLRERWQQTAIETSEYQARYDHVRNNLAELARQNGLQRSLEELTTAPAMEDALGQTLAELARHNVIRGEFEAGLAAASESLGLLRGISTGLTRFHESVGKVLQEKRRYSLPSISIEVPRQAAAINQTWDRLRQEVRDEEAIARAPVEFTAMVKRYVIDRLTPAVIQQYFESMGEALNRATRAWK